MPEVEYKKCPNCDKKYPLTTEYWHKSKKSPNGFRYVCKKCRNKKNRKYYRENKYKYNSKERVKKHINFFIDDLEKMQDKQNSKCLICGIHESRLNKKLCIDHDHKTGEVRGLICSKCNRILGQLNDDIDYIKKFIKYLKGEL